MTAIQSAISQLQSRQSTFPTNSSAVESVAVVPRLGQKVSFSFKTVLNAFFLTEF